MDRQPRRQPDISRRGRQPALATQPTDRDSGSAEGRGADRDGLSAPNRDRILAAATEEFAAKGFEGATTAGVARRAGVTQPLVHYHFDSKDELWRVSVGTIIERLDDSFAGALNELSDLSAVDRLKVLVRRFVHFCAANPQLAQIVVHEGAAGGERLEWLLRQHSLGQLALFGSLLGEGEADGWIKPLPVEHLAMCLGAAAAYMFIVKATMRELFGVDVEDPDTIERHADTVVELFFDGMLTPGAKPDQQGRSEPSHRARASSATAQGGSR